MSEDNSEDKPKTRSDSFNRRSFVKALGGAGGAAITGGVFSSSAQAAAQPPSSSKSRQPVTGDELDQLIREVTEQEDVTNVMDATMRKTVQSGTEVEVSHGGSTSAMMITRNPPQAAKENGLDNLTKDDLIVSGMRHTLENGNEMTVVAFGNDDRILAYHGYDEITDGVKDVAKSWDIVGENRDDMKLVLEKSSFNGTPTKSRFEFTNNACECNPAPAPEQGNLRNVCQGVNVNCAITRCSACYFVCFTPVTCLTCLVATCPYLIATCCTNYEKECTGCPGP
jgi:hypothetical protein